MELWIPITIGAAFMQNMRSALQKQLSGRLSTNGATYTRFVFAFPFAILYAVGLVQFGGFETPRPNADFALHAVVGGAAQIVATALLVYLFSLRNFAVGVTYSKTETVQTAIIGLVILAEPVTGWALAGILVSLAGVMLISVAKGKLGWKGLLTGWTHKSALVGVLSGSFFGVSAVSYRAASLSLGGEGFLMQAAFTLACVTVFQTVIMSVYLRWREPGEIGRVFGAWRVAAWVGLVGMLGSAGWFTAMTIQNAALVRTVGQIELIFAFAASYLIFRERTNATELAGVALVVGGIVILLQ